MSLAAALGLRDPAFLALALAVPVAWVALPRARSALGFAPASLVREGGLPRSWRERLRGLPRLLQAAGLLLVVVALARPVERVDLPLRTEGIDILLCLDTSSSMGARDMEEGRTRLEVAREAAVRFVNGRPHDRIGLLAFARYPDLRCPLTRDHLALAQILRETPAVSGDGPEDATGIGTALARAAQALDSGAGKSRVAILFTDGEENVASPESPEEIAPEQAAQLCVRLGVRVHAIVAGPGPDVAGGAAAAGGDALGRAAARTGGARLRAPDAAAVDEVYARIDGLEKTVFEEPRRVLEDRFPSFLLAALSLLLLSRLLDSTVLRTWP